MAKVQKPAFINKVINPAQLGGIETSVLDNGLGRGTRIAWVNTGSGLRYKIAIDRAFDIVETFFNQHSLAFLTHASTYAPRQDANHGLDWLIAFNAGLLTTCGLTHTGGPESDANGERGIHGRISNTPAELISIIQPDPLTGNNEFSLTAVVKESEMFGPKLELRRTISGTLGRPVIRISDTVTNKANVAVPHMILYHFNFGYPLIDEGTKIVWKGSYMPMGRDSDKEIFNNKHDFKTCPAPLAKHNGYGESVGIIDIAADKQGGCSAGLYNPKLGVALKISFNKQQLPWLTNWQHFGTGEYVVGIEPGTNPPIGQAKARQAKTLIMLEPGEQKQYDLELSVLTGEKEIKAFAK